MKNRFAAIFIFTLLPFFGCSSPEEDLPKIEFKSDSPKEVTVGDTLKAFLMIKTFVDVNGRQATDEGYTGFTLTSADSGIATIGAGKLIIGVKPGTVNINAKDNASGNLSETPLTLTVKPRP